MSSSTGTSILQPRQVRALMGRISDHRVQTRKVGGATLSYVAAWDVKAALTRVFGFGGFSAEVIDSKVTSIIRAETHPWHTNNEGKAKTPEVIAQSTVRLTIFGIGPNGEDAVYTETAIGSNSGWTIGDTSDNAIKSASSDALKRCATYLGTQFGLSLYAGTKQDVVGVLLNEEQADYLTGDPDPDPATQNALSRATSPADSVPPSEDVVPLPGEEVSA